MNFASCPYFYTIHIRFLWLCKVVVFINLICPQPCVFGDSFNVLKKKER